MGLYCQNIAAIAVCPVFLFSIFRCLCVIPAEPLHLMRLGLTFALPHTAPAYPFSPFFISLYSFFPSLFISFFFLAFFFLYNIDIYSRRCMDIHSIYLFSFRSGLIAERSDCIFVLSLLYPPRSLFPSVRYGSRRVLYRDAVSDRKPPCGFKEPKHYRWMDCSPRIEEKNVRSLGKRRDSFSLILNVLHSGRYSEKHARHRAADAHLPSFPSSVHIPFAYVEKHVSVCECVHTNHITTRFFQLPDRYLFRPRIFHLQSPLRASSEFIFFFLTPHRPNHIKDSLFSSRIIHSRQSRLR